MATWIRNGRQVYEMTDSADIVHIGNMVSTMVAQRIVDDHNLLVSLGTAVDKASNATTARELQHIPDATGDSNGHS